MHMHSWLLRFDHYSAIYASISLCFAGHYVLLHPKLHETVVAQTILLA
jgi:hypothetical protein